MSRTIRIGNQTAASSADRMAPFEFALRHGFDAFEWFADKKWNADGSTAGWDESDMDPSTRVWIRDTGRAHDVLFTVHAPWQANPLHEDGAPALLRSIDFARDIGAVLVNLHLYMDDGAAGYVRALGPVIHHAVAAGLRLSIENTPQTTPDDFNRTFARLRELDPTLPGQVGMCLDIGHANLCAATRNDYLRYLDELSPDVPLIHLHLHENFGDADTHLPLFTGPARTNDAGVRGLLERLRRRSYRGALILEQWPSPPELLVEAATRLRGMLPDDPFDVAPAAPESVDGRPPLSPQGWDDDSDFLIDLVESARRRKSWRGRLEWVRDRLVDRSFRPTEGRLATIAVYLRFLATGELKCEEDGGHFRPNHSAEAAYEIEAALERSSGPDTAWVLRRLYPYLPSWGEEFRRAEPLTRIRDIAHRNDIPPDLKREIKERLQNKLHRSAGPEDLRTSAEILARVTAPGAGYSPAFVAEFRTFHGELREFFNATGLDDRLNALIKSEDAAFTSAVRDFLALKAKNAPADRQLSLLTDLRRRVADRMSGANLRARSRLRLADVGLEDYAFTLLSECANRLESLSGPGFWSGLLPAVAAALDNLRLSLIALEECAALLSELLAWADGFRADDRFHLLRLMATLSRARRLAEEHADRVGRLFPPRAEAIGRPLGVAEHAVKVYAEGEVRGHLVFQLSRLLELGLRAARAALRLRPWEAVVPGEACGELVRAAALTDVEGEKGPLLLLLDRADGEAEIPAGVKGVLLAHPMPLLSHLGVRARQARVPFAACAGREHLAEYERFVGTEVRLRVTPDGPSLSPAGAAAVCGAAGSSAHGEVLVPEALLSDEVGVWPLEKATPLTCGAKAAGARWVLEVAGRSNGLFRAPRGLAVPFGVMERCLDAVPAVRREYLALSERVSGATAEEREPLLGRLRDLLTGLPVPDEIGRAVVAFFGPEARLAVRSSANGEDLEHLAGAGLYESVVNVPAAAAPEAIARVWASLWTHQAALSRTQAGIAHDRIHMAVLLHELVRPDLSFIMHTANPLTGNRGEALVEVAVGLGEVLASSPVPGTPYRLACDRTTGAVELLSCATFSVALRPGADGGVVQDRLDYSRVALSADRDAAPRLGKRLGAVATVLEEGLGRAQDVEGAVAADEVYVVQTRPQQGL
jgi:phosphoglucan,water dikinase